MAQTTSARSQANQSAAEEQNRKKKLIIYVCLALTVLVIAVYWFLHRGEVETDDAYTHGRIVAIAPHVSGFVQQMNINDNQFVHKGDLLVVLDGRDYLADLHTAQAALEQSMADMDADKLMAQVAEKNFPGALVSAKGSLKAAEGEVFKAQRDYMRQQRVMRAATSQQDIDASKAALMEAEGNLLKAQGTLEQALPVEANVASTHAKVTQAQASVTRARAAIEKAQLDVEWTQIRAPYTGWISQRNIEHGMFIQAGQTMFSIIPKDIWIVANYKETQITDIRVGQPVTISVDAYPDLKLKGHVDSFQMGSGESFSTFPPENATGNFVKTVQRVPVKILIDSGLDPERPLAIGLSVEPTVHTLHHMHPVQEQNKDASQGIE